MLYIHIFTYILYIIYLHIIFTYILHIIYLSSNVSRLNRMVVGVAEFVSSCSVTMLKRVYAASLYAKIIDLEISQNDIE